MYVRDYSALVTEPNPVNGYKAFARRSMLWVTKGYRHMARKSDTPVFTGSELALADALILVMDVLMLHGIMKPHALESVFVFLEERYHSNGLKSSAAMAQYLRSHLSHPDQEAARKRLRASLDEPEGTA
jgi:hypothetical protein